MSWATIAADLADRCIAPLGNDVTIGGVAGKGILKSPSESLYDGVVILTDWMVELPVNSWASVAEGTTITVDGVTYLAREQGRVTADGSAVLVPLELVPSAASGDYLATLTGLRLVTLDGTFIITS